MKRLEDSAVVVAALCWTFSAVVLGTAAAQGNAFAGVASFACVLAIVGVLAYKYWRE